MSLHSAAFDAAPVDTEPSAAAAALEQRRQFVESLVVVVVTAVVIGAVSVAAVALELT
jgi:hypothetical protein